MKVGVPREVESHEHPVATTSLGVPGLTRRAARGTVAVDPAEALSGVTA